MLYCNDTYNRNSINGTTKIIKWFVEVNDTDKLHLTVQESESSSFIRQWNFSCKYALWIIKHAVVSYTIKVPQWVIISIIVCECIRDSWARCIWIITNHTSLSSVYMNTEANSKRHFQGWCRSTLSIFKFWENGCCPGYYSNIIDLFCFINLSRNMSIMATVQMLRSQCIPLQIVISIHIVNVIILV